MKKLVFVMSLWIFMGVLACQSQPPAKSDNDKKKQGTDETEVLRLTARYLDGKLFEDSIFEGDKILFAYFDIHREESLDFIHVLEKIAPYQQRYRFHIVLVSVNHDSAAAVKKYIEDAKVLFPVVLDDAQLTLADKLGIEDEVALRAVDNKHKPTFGIKKFAAFTEEGGEEQLVTFLKENLSIKDNMPNKPILGYYPEAPDFTAKTLDGKTLKLSALRGKVVHLIFFLPTCPHCQEEMIFLRDKVYADLHPKGYEVVALSMADLADKKMADTLKAMKFTWTTVDDHKHEIRKKYSSEGAVPENYIIDKQGRIRYTNTGFDALTQKIHYPLLIKSLLGIKMDPTAVLSDKRFNGAQTCGVCHEVQLTQWQSTPHAHAFETLLLKGEDRNPECVGCHSVGMNDPRGYKVVENEKTHKQSAMVLPVFQNVQCENCHGIGGPHKPATPKPGETKKTTIAAPVDMETTCLTCHTEKFSLHFDYKDRLAKVDHSNAGDITKMTREQRLALLTKVVKDPGQLFGTDYRYVGSTSCMQCHTETYKHWQDSAHGKAFTDDVNKDKDPDWLRRHTVGYGQPSGYQDSLKSDMQGVGCESCHGPGEQHVKTQKKSDIRGLGDDCPFCVIEQICLSCHDATHSPEFNIHNGLRQIKGHGPIKK